MQKWFLFIAALLVIMPLSACADDDWDFFPLDQGLTWGYDDGNVDQIVAIGRIALPEKRTINIFTFAPYNHEKRTFFRLDKKVYEWRNDHYRLWYDFGAKAGDSWKLEWTPVKLDKMEPMQHRDDIGMMSNEDPSLNDINDGAVVTLVETDAKVETPFGNYKNVYHFIITREGVADAGYVEEWFAPGAGCVMRVWDTIAGAHQQRLAKHFRPDDEQNLNYRIDVKLDKQIYMEGYNIEIEVTVLNWSDKEITLEFSSSLQVDYFIDNSYIWSQNNAFTEAITTVTIPARDVHKWTFTHTPEDFPIAPGKHVITVKLMGPDLKTSRDFLVTTERLPLPEGIELSVATEKNTYAQGENIDFTLTATNTTQSDITLKVRDNNPVVYSIDQEIADVNLLMVKTTGEVDVTVPAGGTVDFKGEHGARAFMVKPGEHILYAGLFGYISLAKTVFTVTSEMNTGTVAGNVVTPTLNEDSTLNTEDLKPVSDARVTIIPVMPKNRERELENMPIKITDIQSAITDAGGFFQFDNVSIGAYYVLNVEKEGFYPYSETIWFLGEKNLLNIVLKPILQVPDEPLMFFRYRVGDLLVTFGTGSSVYLPDAPFKAFLSVTNLGEKEVSFTFDSENFVEWSLLEMREQVIWSSTETVSAQKNSAEYILTLNPGESREFATEGTFKDKVTDHGGKYIIRGVLNYTSSSIEGLKTGGVSGAVKVLVVPSEPAVINRVNAQCKEREMYVDLKEKANAVVDILMTDENVEGELQVTELKQNMHKARDKHRFIKMVEIDADEVIRDKMEKAVVRIYYNPDDFGPVFDPNKLTIMHWRDNPNFTIDGSGSEESSEDWEELESYVDTINNYVEATTESFSSFALFEYDESVTAVEENEGIPETFEVFQNSPNPFNPVTLIQFNIPQAGYFEVSVYSIMGQEIARLHSGNLTAGTHIVRFDGSSLASGVYFYRVAGAGFAATRKMLLLK